MPDTTVQKGLCYRGPKWFRSAMDYPVICIVSYGPKYVRYQFMQDDGQLEEKVHRHPRVLFDTFKWELC